MNYIVYFIKDGKRLKWKCRASDQTSAALNCRAKFGLILILKVEQTIPENPLTFLSDLFGFKL